MPVKSVIRLLSLCCVCVLCLAGCVDYDVEIAFDHQHHGEIHQHLQLGDEFTNFNQQEAKHWLKSVEKRARGSMVLPSGSRPRSWMYEFPSTMGQI